MTKDELQKEIARVQKAIKKTESPYLKNDYEKHLRKFKKMLKRF